MLCYIYEVNIFWGGNTGALYWFCHFYNLKILKKDPEFVFTTNYYKLDKSHNYSSDNLFSHKIGIILSALSSSAI